MSIVLPRGLPAAAMLRDEGFAVDHCVGGRALRILLVNLMPDKAATEVQFARLLAASRHRVAMTPTVPDGSVLRGAAAAHVATFHMSWAEAARQRIDGLIVTGAPVERHPFEAVWYWPGLTAILDWAATRGVPAFHVCWAAQAALWHAHRVPKHELAAKASGVFPQTVRAPDAAILRGIGPIMLTPVSRHTEVRVADLPKARGLRVLADSAMAGLCLAEDGPRRAHYMLNHLEYDAGTLAGEYARDLAAGLPARLPEGYFPGDDPAAVPVAHWRPQAVRLFRNWLDQVAAYAASANSAAISRSMKATSAGRRTEAAM